MYVCGIILYKQNGTFFLLHARSYIVHSTTVLRCFLATTYSYQLAIVLGVRKVKSVVTDVATT